MDLLSLFQLTIRRWVVVVPVLLITFISLIWLATHRGTDYSMEGSYLLVASEVIDPVESGLDPLVVADVLDDLLSQQSVRSDLAAQGLSTTYTVDVGESGTLLLTVTADDPRVVVDTANALLEMMPELLEESFGEAATTITAQPVTTPLPQDVTESDGTYSLSTSIVVSPVSADSGNPFPASLATVLSLVRTATATAFETQIAAVAPDATFQVGNTVREAPLVDVVVTAPSATEATTAFAAVRQGVEQELDRLQDSARVNPQFRTVFTTIYETAPEATPSSLVRPAAGIVILGAGVAVGLATLVESFAVGLRRGDLAGKRAPAWMRRYLGVSTPTAPGEDVAGADEPTGTGDTAGVVDEGSPDAPKKASPWSRATGRLRRYLGIGGTTVTSEEIESDDEPTIERPTDDVATANEVLVGRGDHPSSNETDVRGDDDAIVDFDERRDAATRSLTGDGVAPDQVGDDDHPVAPAMPPTKRRRPWPLRCTSSRSTPTPAMATSPL